MAWNRGYKWLITFEGIHGDVGLIQVNGEKLVGDDVRISSTEVVKGDGDIIPGDFTYEVQVVHTEATQAIGSSSSTFTLEVEGYVTEALNYNAEYFEVKDALEKLPTIYTAAVTREAKDATLHTYAWTVTFTHTKREVVQGAGNIAPMIATSSLDCTCGSTTCCSVEVFESVKGTHPKHFEITSLSPATAYYTRVTAYNERGYSLSSVVANKATLGQPLAPSAAVSSIKTGTSLTATWTAPTVDYSTTGYMVESFTSTPINEVQVITTSGSASLPEIQRITVDADAENIAGYFTLEFGGETTDLIAFNALAEGTDSVAQSLARLSTMGPVDVTRRKSRRVAGALQVSCISTNTYFEVESGDSSVLAADDTIFVQDLEFVVDSVTATQINLASSTTCPFNTDANLFLTVYKWSYGYEWDVTFTNQIGDLELLVPSTSNNWAGTNAVLKVDVLRNGVAPLSGTFRVGYSGSLTPPLDAEISAAGMKSALENLDTISQVDVSRFTNRYGYDWRVTFLGELGDLDDMYVNDAALTGPFAVAEVTTLTDGVLPDNYASVSVSGGTSRTANVTSLVQGTAYQLRVRAQNEDGYSYYTTASPSYLSPKDTPGAPFNSTMFALSDSQIKVTWSEPTNTGGNEITRYKIEWDTSSSFSNVALSGNSVTYVVSDGEGPDFCYTIDIVASSASIPRYARVFAYNDYDWSAAGIPTPNSASGTIQAPGAPLTVTATATSAAGILVEWQEPSAMECIYGGNGGSPVTHYVVEWDTRADFGSPAHKMTVTDTETLIGGRDFNTGVDDNALVLNTPYFIRVTAFNGIGGGVAGYVDGATYTSDRAPYPPENVTVSTTAYNDLRIDWDAPERDGGATLEKYRIEYSTNSTFEHVQWADLEVVPEVQTIVAETDVSVELQGIRMTTAVTNEVQTVRTAVTGVDEIQTVTTHCDDVVNEVQRITTTAHDVNEEQSIELTGSDVDEVQLVQTTVDNTDEKQTITILSTHENPEQIVGVIVANVATTYDNGGITYCSGSGTSVGDDCPGLESRIDATLEISFDPGNCGTDSGNTDTNWCTRALANANLIDSQDDTICDSSSCSTTVDLNNSTDGAYAIQAAICGMKSKTINGNNIYFFTSTGDSGDPCNVAVTSVSTYVDAATYFYAFHVEMTAGANSFILGQVPALQVKFTELSADSGTETYNGGNGESIKFLYCYDGNMGTVPSDCNSVTSFGANSIGDFSAYSGGAIQVGTPPTSATTEISVSTTFSAEIFVEGHQPTGQFFLTFECESDVVDLTSPTLASSSTGTGVDTIVTTGDIFEKYGTVYISSTASDNSIVSTYHMVTAISNDGCSNSNYCKAEFTPNFEGSATGTISAEYGVFYSDPDGSYGVSSDCASTRTRDTPSMYPYDSADNIRTNLKSLSNYIDDLLVVRTSTIDASGLTYIWTVTFTHNNGDVNMLVADTTSLTGTNSAGTVTVTVDETQKGSFIKGTFALQTSYPHIYTMSSGTPSDYNLAGLRYNIPATYLDSLLEAETDSNSDAVWGTLTVVRTSYTPSSATRWSGGYTWTITFTSRNGMLPPIVSTSSLTDSAGISTVEVQVGYASATCAGGTATIGNVHACSRAAQTVDDDPSTAVTGNQVTGTFGLSLVDTNGTTYTGIASDLYVADSSGYALSASTLETYLNTDSSWFSQRNAGYDTVRVSRSAVPNSAMGYTYTVTFVKENVGGNVDAFSTVTTALTATATASSSLGVGDIASDGSYVVNKGITITEVVTGAQLQDRSS